MALQGKYDFVLPHICMHADFMQLLQCMELELYGYIPVSKDMIPIGSYPSATVLIGYGACIEV
jgi:hypothetical protein